MTNSRNRRRSVVPTSMRADYTEYHFSPGFEAGGFLFIAGQIGLDENGAAPEDAAEQARIAFTAMGEVLAEAGLDFTDIVSLTSHHVGDVDRILEWFPKVKDEFIVEPYPAWTAVGVSGLAIPGLVVEITAIAQRVTSR
ncbi:RidA family protein [Henriciella sp.]|jgi:enamine deaminase RidA (YjgF/YER057c/UK114 family)|uniref:RidA family protein n=1 Tax=Bacteria TaxID=2 RepID=UPI00262A80DD|nr:RidA family protein [Henriciella sp.]